MMKRINWICCLSAAVLAFMHVGCSEILRNGAKDVTPAVISSASKELANPETQHQLMAAVNEDHVKQMSARLSAGFVDGVLNSLEDPARKARLEAILNGLITKASGTVIDSMLARASDEKVQEQMHLVMRAAVTDLVTVIFETVDFKTGGSEERTKAFGFAVHELAKQATLGFQDALDDTRRDRASGKMVKEDGALIIAVGTGDRILWTLGIGLAAVTLGLAIMLIWAIRKNRLRKSELEQRDNAISLLTEAIKSTATQPGAGELHSALKTSLRDRAGGDHIRKVFGEKGLNLLGIDKTGSRIDLS